MRRSALYSSSAKPPAAVSNMPDKPVTAEVNPSRWRFAALRQRVAANQLYLLWSVVGLLALMLALSLVYKTQGERKLTQDDINAAVLKTLETTHLPSAAAKAYDVISPSVVRVVAYKKEGGKDKDDRMPRCEGRGAAVRYSDC